MMRLKNILPNKYKQLLAEYYTDIKYFSFKVANARFKCTMHENEISYSIKKNTIVLDYLYSNFYDCIFKYKNIKEEPICKSKDSPIWVFWEQGYNNMPEIISICQKSKELHKGKHPLIFLDKNNVKEYTTLSNNIWNKYKKGDIKIQHLADMIRVNLIKNHGGLWMDSSIFCSKDLPDEFFNYSFFSLKGNVDKRFVSNNQWTTFLIGGKKGNVLCNFLNDFFEEYNKTDKPFIDYFMFDCAIALAYKYIPIVKKELDDMPCLAKNCYWLNDNIDKKLSRKLIDEFKSQEDVFYKISWRRKISCKNTLYLWIKESVNLYE